MKRFQPGRYAALDVGSHSVLVAVADVAADGRLSHVYEAGAVAGLARGRAGSSRLSAEGRRSALAAIGVYVERARELGAQAIALVGTAGLRGAENAEAFQAEVREAVGLRLEIVSGEREAELAFLGNAYDPTLPPTEGERAVLDLGGSSTELARGVGGRLHSVASFPLGGARLVEAFLKSDPPTVQECLAADLYLEEALAELDPLAPGSQLLATGGTLFCAAAVQRGSLPQSERELHGARLTHAEIAEQLDLYRTVPLAFRRRIPGLPPDRADVILGGMMILHQLMARLSAARVLVTANGVRHGSLYALARAAFRRAGGGEL